MFYSYPQKKRTRPNPIREIFSAVSRIIIMLSVGGVITHLYFNFLIHEAENRLDRKEHECYAHKEFYDAVKWKRETGCMVRDGDRWFKIDE